MIVGTAGHIDHGKTSLVRRLTGVETDRLKEEKARGITIDLGFAYWQRPNGAIIGFVDVPGHEGLVHNMLAGASGIDFVILVVAADDGIMPQTLEHLAIMDLLGLQQGVVALTKSDLVSEERIAAISAEIKDLLATRPLQNAEIIPLSSPTGRGFDKLAACLDAALGTPRKRAQDRRFRMAVDRSFTLPGLGTTVTGTVLSGTVRVGDHVRVSASGLEARIRSIHTQSRPAESGTAGERCALVLSGAGVVKEAIRRGEMVIDPGLHAPTARIDARLEVLKSEQKPIRQWFPVKVHHAAAEVPGRIVILSEAPIAPGESEFVQLVLERPLAAAAGDRFVVRDTTSRRTVGGGTFVDLRPPERRRRTPERRKRLEALAQNDPAVALEVALEDKYSSIDFEAFARDRALSGETATTIASKLGVVSLPVKAGSTVLSEASWESLRLSVIEALEAFHAASPDLAGMPLEQLRKTLQAPLPGPVFLAALRKLDDAGEVKFDRMGVRRPSHQVRFSSEEERLLGAIVPMLQQEPYRPPRVRDLATIMKVDEKRVRRLLHLASRRGEVEEIAHDHFFTRPAVEAMARIAIELSEQAAEAKFTAADFRDRLENGRKVAIQILEYFDRHGFTIRRQDLRRVNPGRIDLFVPQNAAGSWTVESKGGVPLPVGRPDFKSGWGRQTVSGGFDSHPPPPPLKEASQ
jgi:selenocysteine-specific elongation factor